MMSTKLEVDDVVAILERTPRALAALIADVPDVWSRATEGEGTWSPYDVVGHLVHAEHADWVPRARHILAGETRPFDPFDREAQFNEPKDTPLLELLERFADLRRTSLAELTLMNLGPADLARTGQHPSLGQVTLAQLLATWVVHDLDHIAQVTRTMAKVYTQAVGPWSVYLSILRDREQ